MYRHPRPPGRDHHGARYTTDLEEDSTAGLRDHIMSQTSNLSRIANMMNALGLIDTSHRPPRPESFDLAGVDAAALQGISLGLEPGGHQRHELPQFTFADLTLYRELAKVSSESWRNDIVQNANHCGSHSFYKEHVSHDGRGVQWSCFVVGADKSRTAFHERGHYIICKFNVSRAATFKFVIFIPTGEDLNYTEMGALWHSVITNQLAETKSDGNYLRCIKDDIKAKAPQLGVDPSGNGVLLTDRWQVHIKSRKHTLRPLVVFTINLSEENFRSFKDETWAQLRTNHEALTSSAGGRNDPIAFHFSNDPAQTRQGPDGTFRHEWMTGHCMRWEVKVYLEVREETEGHAQMMINRDDFQMPALHNYAGMNAPPTHRPSSDHRTGTGYQHQSSHPDDHLAFLPPDTVNPEVPPPAYARFDPLARPQPGTPPVLRSQASTRSLRSMFGLPPGRPRANTAVAGPSRLKQTTTSSSAHGAPPHVAQSAPAPRQERRRDRILRALPFSSRRGSDRDPLP